MRWFVLSRSQPRHRGNSVRLCLWHRTGYVIYEITFWSTSHCSNKQLQATHYFDGLCWKRRDGVHWRFLPINFHQNYSRYEGGGWFVRSPGIDGVLGNASTETRLFECVTLFNVDDVVAAAGGCWDGCCTVPGEDLELVTLVATIPVLASTSGCPLLLCWGGCDIL